ncbi:protein of unknown function [Georgfuchsia toluolica]|uniref:Uncharacterized protein n=1 Tax=Georgfuchsia toluolica TaxID=424218 RepID=A0A916J4S1_9PROT|nr:protein of unknown function [Georgfuchsia toluolica]
MPEEDHAALLAKTILTEYGQDAAKSNPCSQALCKMRIDSTGCGGWVDVIEQTLSQKLKRMVESAKLKDRYVLHW